MAVAPLSAVFLAVAASVGLLLLACCCPSMAMRPIRENYSAGATAGSWDEQPYHRRYDSNLNPFYAWNITGTYRGRWSFTEASNGKSRFLNFGKANGISVLELVSSPTKISGVHYVQGAITFDDLFSSEHDLGVAQMRVEGVYIWPFRQLRMVENSGTGGEPFQDEEYFPPNPYNLLGVFSSQLFQEIPRHKNRWRKKSFMHDTEKYCNIEISLQVSRISLTQSDGEHDRFHLEGLMESPAVVDDDGECFSHILLNATSVNIDVYYNKAVNYTLMVTFISFLQMLLLIRQMEHSNTQSGSAKVSIVMIGQQAIMDAYLCLLYLTAGILVESLFNAFATAAFFKFVVFSIFEMRYLLVIWKARRPTNAGEGWELIRRELSVLYSRFYGILLGGILLVYGLHNYFRSILFILYSFWLPQIVTNVIGDTRKPLHLHYIIGMTLTRVVIPLYLFGCPNNFMRIEVDKNWCISFGVFILFQTSVLLLQHFLGSRWFIPRQILPEKYNYCRKPDNNTNGATHCVICMAAIDVTLNSIDYMVTPCDHFFHSGCLRRWMDIKMECPTCRRPLPAA